MEEPLFFIVGLQGEGAAETAKSIGFNAVAYRLPYDAPRKLDAIREELTAIGRLGLKVIVQLPTCFGLQQRLDLRSRTYWQTLENYVSAIVPTLKELPGLAAWQTDDYLERAIYYSNPELGAFLEERYGTLSELNRAWGTDFSDWQQVTREAALAADDDQPWGVGVPSVDVADWMAATFERVMERWAAAIRRWDETTPLMTGRISLYRSLASVPTGYDVVVPAIRPDVWEDDPVAGNVHMVDLARRGGRFDVIPSLYVPLPPSPLYAQGAATWWALEAAIHGARGFCVEDWRRLTTVAPQGEGQPLPLDPTRVRQRLDVLARQLGAIARPEVFNVCPKPNYAFLWTPYAGGLEAFGVPGYGYLEKWSPGQPGWLFWTFRRGCAFGIADVLTPWDVPAVRLDQYGAIFAPHVLSVPAPIGQALTDWVEKGGALVADVGLGMYQSGDWRVMPAPLAAVTGLPQLLGGAVVSGRWQVVRASVLTPLLSPGARPKGIVERRTGTAPATERKPRAFDSWMAYCAPPPDVETIAIADTRASTDGRARIVAGIFGHRHGLGAGIYATFRLWERWDPADPLFAAFCEPLCSFRASYRLAGGFFPGDTSLAATKYGAAMVARSGGVRQVLAMNADDRIYSGAYCYTSAAARTPDGRRSGDVTLYTETPAGGLAILTKSSVAVRPYTAGCLSRLDRCDAESLQLTLYGDVANPVVGGKISIRRPVASQVRILVEDGTYEVAPGSRHLLTIQDKGRQPLTDAVRADSTGHLDFSLWAKETVVTLRSEAKESG
ncbi:MAG: beta-galactosidase [Armatimonadetes bacterium]|nr:beta-galactosidase [Armatimonadota bacterium]